MRYINLLLTLTLTLTYKPSPFQWYQNRFCAPTSSWQNGRTNSDVHKRDEQADKQTDKQTNTKLDVFGRPGGR